MKLRTIVAIAAAGALAAHAVAQSAPPAASGTITTPAAQEPARTTATADRPVEGANDPRRCLDFSTNMEIHACAEKYRPRKRST